MSWLEKALTDITELLNVKIIYVLIVILALVIALVFLLKRKLKKKIDERLEEIDQKLDEVVNGDEEQNVENLSVEEDHLEDEKEDEKTEKFDDDLIKTIAKEAKIEQEEEVDLLRDLKGKDIDVEDLKKELEEVVERLRKFK